jgi:hypothetical protein
MQWDNGAVGRKQGEVVGHWAIGQWSSGSGSEISEAVHWGSCYRQRWASYFKKVINLFNLLNGSKKAQKVIRTIHTWVEALKLVLGNKSNFKSHLLARNKH